MQVRGILMSGVDFVNIDIKYCFADQTDMRGLNARFFSGFFQRHADDIVVAIGVSAGLEPLVKFSVVQYERQGTVRVNDPSRSCYVTWRQVTFKAIGMLFYEMACARDESRLIDHAGLIR
mgnify:CR=1 FL=1